jgi:hypothetical protein
MEALFSFALDLGKDLWTKRMNSNGVTSSEAWDVMMKVPYGKSVSIVNSNPPCSLAGINFELLQLISISRTSLVATLVVKLSHFLGTEATRTSRST